MRSLSAAMRLASVKSQMSEAVPGFPTDWIRITVPALIVLAVVASWGVRIKRRIAYRRAVRSGRPIHEAARYGQGSGADHLGRYAPQRQGGGGGHLGP